MIPEVQLIGNLQITTDGVPHASIQLRGNVERANGTFIPVTTPVVSETRAYILTEFRPDFGELAVSIVCELLFHFWHSNS